MRKILFSVIAMMYLTKIYSQTYHSIGDSLRKNGIKRLVNIQIDEVDSVQFFKKPNILQGSFSEMRQALLYQSDGTSTINHNGTIIDVFSSLIDKPNAYIKAKGVVPKVFIRCNIGIRSNIDTRNYNCNNTHQLSAVSLMENYYNCRLEKVRDSLDVFVIRKENPEKLSPFQRPEKPDSWIDTVDGRLLYQLFVGRLEGQDVATLTSHLAYSYQEIFVLADEDKLDDNKYYIIMEAKHGKNINDAYRELKENGLSLTKEKKMIDFYRLTFF